MGHFLQLPGVGRRGEWLGESGCWGARELFEPMRRAIPLIVWRHESSDLPEKTCCGLGRNGESGWLMLLVLLRRSKEGRAKALPGRAETRPTRKVVSLLGPRVLSHST